MRRLLASFRMSEVNFHTSIIDHNGLLSERIRPRDSSIRFSADARKVRKDRKALDGGLLRFKPESEGKPRPTAMNPGKNRKLREENEQSVWFSTFKREAEAIKKRGV